MLPTHAKNIEQIVALGAIPTVTMKTATRSDPADRSHGVELTASAVLYRRLSHQGTVPIFGLMIADAKAAGVRLCQRYSARSYRSGASFRPR